MISAQYGYALHMAQVRHPVRVDAGEDAEDLLEALSERGFATRRLDDGEIEVESPVEEEGLWNIEVVSALEAWLEEEGRHALVAHVGDAEYTVWAPEGRPEPDEVELEPESPRRPDALVLAAGLGSLLLLAAGVWLIVVAVLGAT